MVGCAIIYHLYNLKNVNVRISQKKGTMKVEKPQSRSLKKNLDLDIFAERSPNLPKIRHYFSQKRLKRFFCILA